MNDCFISRLIIKNVRHLKNLEINLTHNERKHLIFTGKNGSGKTSVLEAMQLFLKLIEEELYNPFDTWKALISDLESSIKKSELDLFSINNKNDLINLKKRVDKYTKGVEMYFNESIKADDYNKGKFIVSYFGAKRSTAMKKPTGISKLSFSSHYPSTAKPNEVFIQYLANLKAQRAFARDDKDYIEAEKIDIWFDEFEDLLKTILESEDIKLVFNSKKFDFEIIDNEKVFDFTTLSDGYSAVIDIFSDLIIRMEKNKRNAYDIQGVVLIDEIETHLHVNLQKKILPLLTSFFPRIQFIITTHSPFVLNSINNAVIYDLEKNILVTDLSAYSYESIVENYFNIDQYSYIIKNKINKYQELAEIEEPNDETRTQIFELRDYFQQLPPSFAPELLSKFYEIELSLINNKKTKKEKFLNASDIECLESLKKRGVAFVVENLYSEALQVYDKALIINPNDDNILFCWGMVLKKLEHYEEALEAFDRALASNPNDSNVWLYKGMVLNNLAHYEEARLTYNKALELNPNDANIWFYLGMLLEKLERYEEALQAFNRALGLNINNFIIYEKIDNIKKLLSKQTIMILEDY